MSDNKFLLTPVAQANAYEETMQRLLQSIRLGFIEPSERLPSERDLAAMLQVSRDTVRDAISTLSEAGYVYSKRGRYGGTFVVDSLPKISLDEEPLLSADEIASLTRLRRILEVGAASEAASIKLRPEQVRALKRALEDCAAAPISDYRRHDSRLHLSIAELSESRALITLMADVRSKTNALLDRFPKLQPNIIHSNKQHEGIVQAILDGDADLAGARMRAHLEGSEALIQGFLVD